MTGGLIVICLLVTTMAQVSTGQQGVYLSLGDSPNIIANNTEISITDIGRQGPSLTYHTDLTTCCRRRSGSTSTSPESTSPRSESTSTRRRSRSTTQTSITSTACCGSRYRSRSACCRGRSRSRSNYCCRRISTRVPQGQWSYPDGSVILEYSGSIAAGQQFYIQRGSQVIRLARREGNNLLSPTGSYCCTVPTTGKDVTLCTKMVLCPSLSLDNGMVTYNDNTLGLNAVATHTCNPGYILNGRRTRSCESDGQWSGSAPSCTALCPFLELPNGMINYSRPILRECAMATHTCNHGYILLGDATRTCRSGGRWTSISPHCAVNCGPLTNPANGQVDTLSGTTFESTATYSCDIGYSLIGDATRTCGSDRVWSGSTPICDPQMIIRFNFDPTIHCVLWNEDKAAIIRDNMRMNIYHAITKSNEYIPLDNIEDGVFSCLSSQNYTTFQATISGTERTNASRAATVVKRYMKCKPVMRVEWYMVEVMKLDSYPVINECIRLTTCLEEN